MDKRLRTLLWVGGIAVVGAIIVANMGGREDRSATVGIDPMLGDGDLVVFLFEDYQCSHCRDYALSPAYEHLLTRWVEPGNITLVFKHVAFVGPYSEDAAVASRCVFEAAPEAWSAWDHAIYESQWRGQAPTRSHARVVAAATGVDMAAYDACMDDDGPMKAAVAANQREFAAIGSTPSILIAGQTLNPFDVAAVDAAMEEALAAG